MAEITKETIEKLLALARIGLSEDEKKNKEPKLVEDLKRILAHVEELSEVDTEGVERVSGGYAGRNAYRSDAEGNALDGTDAIAAFPAEAKGYLKVPGVLEHKKKD